MRIGAGVGNVGGDSFAVWFRLVSQWLYASQRSRRAEAALEDLADLIRVLMRDGRAMTALEKEIRLCWQYLSIEKIRLGDRLKVQWERQGISDEAIYRAQIPILLLQPLLENAVHYGGEPSTEPALIRIKLAHSLERIEITITNCCTKWRDS